MNDEDLFGRGDGDPDVYGYPNDPTIRHDPIPGRWVGVDAVMVERRTQPVNRRTLNVDYDSRFDEEREDIDHA